MIMHVHFRPQGKKGSGLPHQMRGEIKKSEVEFIGMIFIFQNLKLAKTM
jgi:hypothetical protein